MPVINIGDGEDWLKQYQRYKATIWWKRISRKQWVFFGGVGGVGIGIIIGITNLVQSWAANFGGPSINLFGGG